MTYVLIALMWLFLATGLWFVVWVLFGCPVSRDRPDTDTPDATCRCGRTSPHYPCGDHPHPSATDCAARLPRRAAR
ncbi:hypothetical protein ACIRL2_45765 [Embleya sp. NPDC127516]|uniref:hypothetical protein n=1 Tax=Embleya sp. NPDC127516 TaxID=3363990 RepID=UPI0038028D7F